MINFALTQCDFLTVLVCCSDKENISDAIRSTWIKNTLKNKKNLEVRTFNYLESELPNTSESSESVSKLWAEIFKKQFPDYSLLITSEEYGNFVSAFMNIKHIPFDMPRKLFPVSATAVRNNIFTNWNYLPNIVKPYFAIKVVILGTESTGKTSLTEKLTKHFNCSYVLEVGREIIANSNSFNFNELHTVATEHAKRIDHSVIGNSPLVILDTDIHITKSYAQFTFKKELATTTNIYNSNKANFKHLIFLPKILCSTNFKNHSHNRLSLLKNLIYDPPKNKMINISRTTCNYIINCLFFSSRKIKIFYINFWI